MKVKEVLEILEQEGSWVHRDVKTRDHLLVGSEDAIVHKIGVCWVATNKAIQEAIHQHIDLIITHENPFYHCSTQMYTVAMKAAEEKRKLLEQHHIHVYRCHDVWDCIRVCGVADQWAKRLGFAFEPREQVSYYQAANINEMSCGELAAHTAACLYEDGEEGVYVFGNPAKKVRRVAIGTGAATCVYEMLKFQPDAVIVSDDGITNYDAAQFALDQDLPMIVVNHSVSEMAGLKAMVPWLREQIKQANITYLDEGYAIHYYLGNKTKIC